MQNEITAGGNLLDAQGRLIQTGYSKRPVLTYNPENAGGSSINFVNRLRLKEWDYYGMTTDRYFFSVCVSNIGYIGLVFAYLIDFETKEMMDAQKITPLGMGCSLPLTSEEGDVLFRQGQTAVSFFRKNEKRILKVYWPKFNKGRTLQAELELSQPNEMDSIVMCTPMEGSNFYYNHKVNCMPTKGFVHVGKEQRDATPDKALTSLDWGRGVWPYRSFWNWASASGFLPSGQTIGLNLGSGFGDLSSATENCFYIDGKMSKLDWVDIKYNQQDVNAPWTFTENNGRLNLTLTPFFRRPSDFDLLVLSTHVNQMFGHYNGTIIDDAGNEIVVENLIGWAEDHFAKW